MDNKACTKCKQLKTLNSFVSGSKEYRTCSNCRTPEGISNDIQTCKQWAIERNGYCLSTEYVNNHTKMTWKCDMNHVWVGCWQHIKRGNWCRTCVLQNNNKNQQLKIHVVDHTTTEPINNDDQTITETNTLVETNTDKKKYKYEINVDEDVGLLIIPYKFNTNNFDKIKSLLAEP